MVSLPSLHTYLLPKHHIQGASAAEGLFGGNVLAWRTSMTGAGSYEEAIQDLGVTGLRYPGGALTEFYFDIRNPDANVATHAQTGEISQVIPLSEFMAYAIDKEQEVTIVLPTREQLSDSRDINGNRLPEIDEVALRTFVHDVASGRYGEAEIVGLEIGNEYWGSGQMNAVEYGRLSSAMSLIIHDELKRVTEIYGVATEGMHVLVQMGSNNNFSRLTDEYAGWSSKEAIEDLLTKYPGADLSYNNIRNSGEVNWIQVNNELVIMSFDTPEEIDAIDSVVGHVYTKGFENEGSRVFILDNIRNTWLDKKKFADLDIYITEWNQKSTEGLDRNEDYGLIQAHEMLNIVEEFMDAGVDRAFVWPLIQNTANTLARGFDYSGLTAPGQMFAMMSDTLPGKAVIDFTPNGDRSTEYSTGAADVHAFAGQGDMVLYIASTTDNATKTDIDLSNFVVGFDALDVRKLGVAPGEAPGRTASDVEVQELGAEEVFRGGVLEVLLERGEIMQVVLRGVHPTVDFAPTLAAIDAATDGDDKLFGNGRDNTFQALLGDDTITGGAGDDRIDGGEGRDTAVYSGSQESYILTLSATSTSLMDRRTDGSGTDQLIDIELLKFIDEGAALEFDLTQFGGMTSLSQERLESFIELYIAFFNRAPDAMGLNFWGTAFANGATLEEIASEFVDQDEMREAYPDRTSNDTFVRSVYHNVLGRLPDDAGASFWTDFLDSGEMSRDRLILEILRGAKSELKPDLGQAFVDQQLTDRAYLSNKIDIGAYFAVHKGMSDVNNAADVMVGFNGSEDSVIAAFAAIDSYYGDALDPDDGEFLMPVVGILHDPAEVA